MALDPIYAYPKDAPPLPEWITTGEPITPPARRTKGFLEIEEIVFDNFFEHALAHLEQGGTLRQLVRQDPRAMDYGRFMRWVVKDETRNNRYREALKIGVEFMAGEIIDIADGENDLEDIARSRLRMDARLKTMAFHNKELYGDNKQIEHNVNINLGEAMRKAQLRLDNVIEGEFTDGE